MKTGSTVRPKRTTITGTVTQRRIKETDDTEFLVEWTDDDGQTVHRWFDENLLDEVTA